MDYSEQQKFVDGFSTRWLIAASVTIVLASLALREPTRGTVAFVGLIVSAVAALAYLPKYLHLHHEPEKRFVWAVRSRWIIAIVAILICATVNFRSLPILTVTAAAGIWLALVNGFVAMTFRQERLLPYRWLPLAYFFGDFWLVVVLGYLGLDPFVLAGLLAASLTFALVLNDGLEAWFPLAGMALSAALLRTAILPEAYGFNSSFLILEVALVAGAASLLTMFAAEQAKRNYHQTADNLHAFTGLEISAVKKSLRESRQILVDAWKAAQPDESDKQVLADWYAINSLSYLFDIARFHLTYKHISFSLDVLKLSRGRCLDYGAGKGELAIALAKRGCLVTYFDIPGKTREYAEWNARRQDLAIYFTSRKEDLARQELRFDTIISLDALEHLPDLKGELAYLDSLLVSGGRMILTLPAGATESHPMHLQHQVAPSAWLRERGYIDLKTWKTRLLGSEILRNPDCVIMQKP